jgi:hypothetical protein
MTMRKRLRPYLASLEELGLTVEEISHTGSNHYKITVIREGNRHFFIASYSASDRRGLLNFKSDARRWVQSLEEKRS